MTHYFSRIGGGLGLTLAVVGLLFFSILLNVTEATGVDDFVTTWKTDNPGVSSSTAITIPGTGSGYLYSVLWSEVGNPANTGSVSDIATNSYTLVFPSAGTYEVRISGNFPRLYFNNTGDRQKILTVEQWGTNAWSSMQGAFYGATNLTVPATDAPNLTGVISLSSMFRGATSFNQSINHWDVSNVTSLASLFYGTTFNQPLNDWDVSAVIAMDYLFYNNTAFNQPLGSWDVGAVGNFTAMFRGATAFNQPLGSWNTVSANNMTQMFRGATAFNQPLGSWNVENVTAMNDMFLSNTVLSVTNYDNLLNGWGAQSLQTGVVFLAGSAKYCSGSSARGTMILVSSWTITDGGENSGCGDTPPVYSGTFSQQTNTAGINFLYETAGHFSGTGPITYRATGLPNGITIDSASGLISGTTNNSGTSSVVVIATNGGGDSAPGSFDLVVSSAVPASPQSLIVTFTTPTTVLLIWNEPTSDGGSVITDYVIEQKLFSGGSWEIFTDTISVATTTTITGLVDATSYQFRVAAINNLGTGTWSNIVTQKTGVYFAANNSFACLANPGPLQSFTGDYVTGKYKPVTADNKKFDARNATFTGPQNMSWANVELRGTSLQNMCWAGGYFTNALDWHDLDVSWNQSKNGLTGDGTYRNTTSIESYGNNSVITGIYAHNVHDGIRTTNSNNNWTVQHSWFDYVRDDCIENDHSLSGTIYDNLFDGCYVGFSSRPTSDWPAAGKTITMDKDLFRLEPMPYPYKWDTKNEPKLYVDGYDEPFGHGMMFKLEEGNMADFRITNTVFLIEYDANTRWFPPKEFVSECSNNTLIWLGEASTTPTYLLTDFPGCFTIITDQTAGRAFWKNVVADWHERHPDVGAGRKPTVPGEYSWPRYAAVVTAPVPVGLISSQSAVSNSTVAITTSSSFSGTGLTFSASGLPSGLIINATTGIISGQTTTVGPHSITVTASNSAGSVGQNFTLSITSASSGSSSSSGGGGSRKVSPPLTVLPTSISTPPNSATSYQPIRHNISLTQTDWNQPADVFALQSFLNNFEGTALVVDGIYKSTDGVALRAYQLKYAPAILTIWGLTEPTGYVGVTTRLHINARIKGQQGVICPAFVEYNAKLPTAAYPVITQSVEVAKLQDLLRDLDFYTGTSTGIFTTATELALKKFQLTFRNVMLDPWKITTPTGIKYKTTNLFLNYLNGCAGDQVQLEGVGSYQGISL